jgi:hypothetical protein
VALDGQPVHLTADELLLHTLGRQRHDIMHESTKISSRGMSDKFTMGHEST